MASVLTKQGQPLGDTDAFLAQAAPKSCLLPGNWENSLHTAITADGFLNVL